MLSIVDIGRGKLVEKSASRLPEGELGVDAEASRGGNGLHQECPDELLGLRPRRGVGFGAAGLVLPGRALGIDPAEDLARVEERRQVLRQLGGLISATLDLALDLLPLREDLSRRRQILVAVHVRVTADQFRGAGLGHRGQVPLPPLLEKQGEEEDLEEDIAELVDHRRGVVTIRCVGELIRLLDGVRDDRAGVLLAVPRTLAAQSPGDLVEMLERL
jgi:hypothetical protein